MEQERISVIIPCYNAERTIQETIESVRRQFHSFWEVVVVNDGSSDHSGEIVAKMAREEKRIQLVSLTTRKGVSMARNAGLEQASGRYVAFLDADDIWAPDKLNKQLALMRKRDAAIVFNAYQLMDAQGNLLKRIVPVPEKLTYPSILKGNRIGISMVLLDRERTGPIRFEDKRHEDFRLWIKLLKQGHEAWGINEVLTLYRQNGQSLSGNKLLSAVWTWQVYRQQERLALPSAAYYFTHYCIQGVRKYML